MANSYFKFKQFSVSQDRCAMKVTTDGCLFGAWVAEELSATAPQKILDIGCGTGLLSLMIAQKNDTLSIHAIDIDEAAAAQASENSKASPWKERITIINDDVKAFAKNNQQQYDCIVCNPPFYENELASPDTKRKLAHHSDALTLPEVIQSTQELLTGNGRFFLLLPYKRSAEAIALIEKAGLCVTTIVNIKPVTTHPFFRVMIAGRLQPSEAPYTVIESAIKDESGNYTAEFTRLLKDYYLYL